MSSQSAVPTIGDGVLPHDLHRELLASLGRPLADVALESCLLPTVANRDALRQVGSVRARKIKVLHEHRCAMCGGHPRRLHMHHIYYHAVGGRSVEENLLPLCHLCHRLAHMGLWPTSMLHEHAAGRPPIASDLTEPQLANAIHAACAASGSWVERLRMLHAVQCAVASTLGVSILSRMLMTADVLTHISSTLTTFGPPGSDVAFRSTRVAANRLVGAGLVERALLLLRHSEAMGNRDVRPLQVRAAYCLTVHLRSSDLPASSIRAWKRWMPAAADAGSAVASIRDSDARSYVMRGHALDLIRQARNGSSTLAQRGLALLDACVEWVRNGANARAYAEAELRRAEGQLGVGAPAEALHRVESVAGMIRSNDTILRCIQHKLAMRCYFALGDSAAGDREFAIALRLATTAGFTDQERKVRRAYAVATRRRDAR